MTRTTVWTKAARRLGFDHNPLRRRADLIEAWLVPAMIAVFLILSPLAALGSAHWARADNAAAQRGEQTWHRVSAELLQAAPGPMLPGNGGSWLVWTPARWTADGMLRTGKVPAPSGTSAGALVPVWLDSAGHVQIPPLTTAAARDRVLVAGAFALAALALLLAGLTMIARRLLDRRRLAGWAAAWRAVGPQWSRHG